VAPTGTKDPSYIYGTYGKISFIDNQYFFSIQLLRRARRPSRAALAAPAARRRRHRRRPRRPSSPSTADESEARLLLQVASPARRRLEKATSVPRPLETGAASSAIPDAEATSAAPVGWVRGGGTGPLN